MRFLKERKLETGQKVYVYFNLHKKCFSVKDVKSGLVVAHTDFIELTDCNFKVSEAGRQRVLREQKKNVHAGVVGHYQPNMVNVPTSKATYNPYKYSSFVDIETKEAISSASSVVLMNKTIHYNQ